MAAAEKIGSHPHDPLARLDGSIWYTGQMANLLGRLDPRTGEFKEYHLKTPESEPHGLVADKDGNIWFTAGFKGYIGKLDPNTGEISENPMPDSRAHDPHTISRAPQSAICGKCQGGSKPYRARTLGYSPGLELALNICPSEGIALAARAMESRR